MAIHGHTRIELRDVNTGEKKIVEDDNMVTNALAKMLRPANGWATVFGSKRFYPKRTSYYMSMADVLLGGVLCFENIHEENGENYFKDPLNKLIAKASNYAYTGADVTQGSYNIEESGKQPDGSLKKVWDFATNQGNGTIASVSLTNCYYGELGDGCLVENEKKLNGGMYGLLELTARGLEGTMSNYASEGYVPAIYLNDVGRWHVYNDSMASLLFCYADYKENYAIFIDDAFNAYYYDSKYADRHFFNSKKIFIKKMRIPFSKISIFTNPYDFEFGEEGEIMIPEEILAQCNGVSSGLRIYSDVGYIYMIIAKRDYCINPGEMLRILKINVSDFSTEIINVTNTTNTCIYINSVTHSSSYRSLYFGFNSGGINITNEYFIFHSYGGGEKTNGKIYRINLKNNADTAVFKMNGEEFTCTTYLYFQKLGDMLYADQFAINIKSTEIKYCKRYNGSSGSIWLSEERNGFEIACEAYGEKLPVFFRFIDNKLGNDDYLKLVPCFRIDTLMTINNLPEPVIKTASQTMKITYTITEE